MKFINTKYKLFCIVYNCEFGFTFLLQMFRHLIAYVFSIYTHKKDATIDVTPFFVLFFLIKQNCSNILLFQHIHLNDQILLVDVHHQIQLQTF